MGKDRTLKRRKRAIRQADTRWWVRKRKEIAILTILALILLNAAHYAFTHYEGPAPYGDDPVYTNLAADLLHGNYVTDIHYIFSLRIGQFAPIALSYALFGVNTLTSSLWDISAYLGLIIVAFLIMRMLYDDKAALIASFLISVYPLVTKYAVGTGEDPPLVFIGSLAVLLFLYAKEGKFGHRKALFFASGALLVFDWLIGVEAVVFILFLFGYAAYEVLRKRIAIDRTSIFFIYGAVMLLLVAFVISWTNSGNAFVFVTGNFGFYSGVGKILPNGQATIPSANTNLLFYPDDMFQYGLTNIIEHSSLGALPINLYKTLFDVPSQVGYTPISIFGIFYYMAVPAIALLIFFRDKRSYFLLVWFAFMTLFLEFGPMHVGVSFSPFHITYLLQHRLDRFMMIAAIPLVGILSVAIAKMLEVKSAPLLIVNIAIIGMLFVFLYMQNGMAVTYYYNWQHYPASMVMQPANFLRYNESVNKNSTVFLEGFYGSSLLSYSVPSFDLYLGYPKNRKFIYNINNETNCSTFTNGSYVVWSGQAHCGGWTNVFNVSVPKGIPQYFITYETPTLAQTPTNVYRVG